MSRTIFIAVLLLTLLNACLPGPASLPTPTPTTAPVEPEPTEGPPTPTPTLVVRAPAAPGTPTAIPKTPTPMSARNNPFGLMLGPDALGIDRRITLIKSLDGVYFRPADVNLDEWRGTCAECSTIERSGLKVLLTVRANGGTQKATTPPQDLVVYKRTLSDILDKRKPELLVVENEENDAQLFFAGSPQQYGDELRAACEVAHSKGIKCTNGGLVSSAVVLLVWANYIDQNSAGLGCGFVRRALNAQEAQVMCNARALSNLPAKMLTDLNRGREFLQVYRGSSADFINFHWYVPDPDALSEAVNYMRKAVNKPVLINEMGQQSDNVSTIQPLLQRALDLGLPYVIWFSIDAPKARALNNPDGSLRSTGEAFRQFMQIRFK